MQQIVCWVQKKLSQNVLTGYIFITSDVSPFIFQLQSNSDTVFLNLLRLSLHSSTGILERKRSNDALSPTLKKDTTHLMNAILILTGTQEMIGTLAVRKRVTQNCGKTVKGHTVKMEWDSDWTSTILR